MYDLQSPHITFNFLMVAIVIMFIMVAMVIMFILVAMVIMVVTVVRTGQDKTDIET